MNDTASISVVIPVFNASHTLEQLAERLSAALSASAEVVFVEDASSDDSWAVIERLVSAHPTWTGIQLGLNSGQHSALLAGIRAARNATIVTMDDDLQHRPEDIAELLEGLSSGIDLVYGLSRTEEHGQMRSLASRTVKQTMERSLRIPYAGSISAFRCFRANLRDAFDTVNDPYISIDVLLSWSTSRVTTVQVAMDTRPIGTSGYRFRSLVRHTINMVTGYSGAPLRIVAYLGLMLAALGFGSLIYVMIRYLLGDVEVRGFTFLAALLSLVGGMQMLAIAVLGEYLARVHFRTMRKPSYFIRRVVGGGRD